MDRYFVGFQDLEFEHRFLWQRNREGRADRRWTAIGMPRIPKKLECCAFYLFGLNPKTGNMDGPGATGAFIARASQNLAGEYHIYAVSNRHAIIDYSCIRINTKSGSTRTLDFGPHDWIYSKADDLAAVDVTDEIDLSIDDISLIYESDFLTHDLIRGFEVGIGDHIFMMGLFADHDGGKQNTPVCRFGNIAAMPDASRPVTLYDKDPYARPSYLNDMRSRTGFSGSPVWVWRTPVDDLNNYSSSPYSNIDSMIYRRTFLCFVGIHRGQFQETITILASKKTVCFKKDTEIKIASAMTVVVPAWEISDLLDKTELRDQRDARDNRRIDRARGRVSLE